MSKQPIYNFYHVTTYARAKLILDAGKIDPSFSEGKRAVCWYVTRHIVPWAIAHTCARHECGIADCAILCVRAHRDEFHKSNRGGIYWTPDSYRPLTMDSATMWLNRIERAVFIPGSLTTDGRKKRAARE